MMSPLISLFIISQNILFVLVRNNLDKSDSSTKSIANAEVDLKELGDGLLGFRQEDDQSQNFKRNITKAENISIQAVMRELLNMHNFYRRKVKPPAANMHFLTWDNSLERKALKQALKCAKVEFTAQLQPNLGYNSAAVLDAAVKEVVDQWLREGDDYDISRMECLRGGDCSHYTQMMWADSQNLGCSIAKCTGKWHNVVCLYFPRGNVKGMPPYIIGKPCTQCGYSRSEHYLCHENLCSKKKY